MAKSAFHRYLSEIMNSWEGSEAETWDELEPTLLNLNLPFIRIIRHVFEMLHDGSCIMIDLDSMEILGAMYLTEMVQNTPMEDLMKYTRTFRN